jgi:hypothetical protein
MKNLLIIVLVFPLLSFVSIASFGRFIGVYGSMFLTVVNIAIALVCSIVLFVRVSFDSALYVEL